MKKRPTDEQLRRRVAKAKGWPRVKRSVDGNGWRASGDDHLLHPANWLESLDAAVGLLEELRSEGAIESYTLCRVGERLAWCWCGTWRESQPASEDTTLCRACVLAYLSVMEAKR